VAVKITMPKWGLTMQKGKITKWLKKEGDAVEKGEPLFEVETEKITNKVESIVSGILFQIVAAEGSTVLVGTVVAVIAKPGEQAERIEELQGAKAVGEAAPARGAPPAEAAREEAGPKAFVPATPAARRLARQWGIDLSLVSGSGPEGRVTEADVTKYHEEGPPAPRITPLALEIARKEGLDISTIQGTGDRGKIVREDVMRVLKGPSEEEEPVQEPYGEVEQIGVPKSIPYSGMRRLIGDNMLASLQAAAQLSAFVEVDVTEMVELLDLVREEHKKDPSVRVSYNDIIILAVSRALKRHPMMNSTLVGEEILLYDDVNMGIAVALADGLIVPVLKDADKKGLLAIAREARDLASRAREGKLTVDDVTGGTFTISNTGMLEVDGFTPILRPPETGILGVGRVKRKPAEYRGEIALRHLMTISLTYDHRVVDGVPAHEFLQTVGRYLQHPALIMT
jgi:pyruvate dehydrogenase E2 component (dihydrolipoamide acetyltransferase)